MKIFKHYFILKKMKLRKKDKCKKEVKIKKFKFERK